MRSPSPLLGAALGVALGACGLDFPPVIWSGEHIDYATSRDETLCAGTFHLQDRFVGALAEYLGIRLRNRDRILFAYVEPEEIGEFCPSPEVSGCANQRRAFSSRPFHRHELTHSVTMAAGWHGPAPFEEGVAEVFGDGFGQSTRSPVREVLSGFAYRDDEYYTMALFVRFLLERHGLPPFAAFMKETEREDTPEDYAATFATLFGETLDESIAAFEEYPSCSRWNNRIPLLECAEVEPWVGDRIAMRIDVRCDNPEFEGPFGPSAKFTGYRAFEVEEEGEYRFAGSSELTMGMKLTHCGSCTDNPGVYSFVTGKEPTIHLPRGRYFLAFDGTASQETTVDLEITRLR